MVSVYLKSILPFDGLDNKGESIVVKLEDNSTIEDLLIVLKDMSKDFNYTIEQYGTFVELCEYEFLLSLNGRIVQDTNTILYNGDVVMILPSFAGG